VTKWLVVSALGIGMVTALIYFSGRPVSRPTLNLLAADDGGKVRIQWDRSAQPVLDARKASVLVVDGDQKLETELTPKALQKGKLTYERKSPDVEIRLRVYGPNSDPVQELTRLLGLPAAPEPADAAEPGVKWVEMGKTASIAAPDSTDSTDSDR
jgi:hypothetical protein